RQPYQQEPPFLPAFASGPDGGFAFLDSLAKVKNQIIKLNSCLIFVKYKIDLQVLLLTGVNRQSCLQ
ncbi:hypothetical protein, partial [Hymenobacter properus]|uniref:hypothetical protein n=1 Tax=Hymenobacter properus TaxID=2791026 RepID=UPI001B838688